MKLFSKELENKFDELSEKEFSDEQKKKFNKNHFAKVIFAAIGITYIVFAITYID